MATKIRLRWAGALLTVLSCVLLVATPNGAFAAQHRGAGSKKPVEKGFFVSGQGRVTGSLTPTALIRDENGGQHVVTTVQDAAVAGDMGRIDYLTRKAGAKTWVSHLVPGLRPMAGGINVELHLSTDGLRVVAVFYECDGVYAVDASLTSSRLPEPTQVLSLDNCADPTVTDDSPPIADAIVTPGHKIGVVLPDPAQDNEPAIFTGTPGGTFTPGPALPTVDGFTPVQITTDPASDRMVVVGNGTDGTNEGIYVTAQGRYDDEWTAPTLIASLDSPTTDYAIEAVTSYLGSTWVGLQRPPGIIANPKHSLFIVHGTPSNEWLGAIPLPHSTTEDTALRLVINDDTSSLHAAFTRINPLSKTKGSGIMQEARSGSGWAKPKYFTSFYRDTADQITFNAAGHAVIGYTQV